MKRIALRNKAELEKTMNQEEESTTDLMSSYSPIDEWSYQGDFDDKEPEANYDPYLDIARLFNSHTLKEVGRDNQRKNKNIGKHYDHLVRGDEKYDKSNLNGVPNSKPLDCKTEGFEVVRYTFGPTRRFVAIKKQEEYYWMTLDKNACCAYQDIFHKIDEGWFVTRAE